ncbi:endoplasmic reticulum-Golgi intermediate compartment family protein KNAG_0E00290 [Huiozyma naganishii CBS 8797]|uniref:Endoplasmic reticulum-Golgi intermediate compartment protein n=1 Tax=Huiozyma naganishii (strain ATCC MYA-139 / BCRC 22969 / CBS 8797 / KCTC 17520 / NBRC 10181 / NCYC 3082 / Yp74L-3) TaxID=1071383 RepID=J7RYP6_HUIN7|nr:hypothetical protein KNAG_0E00290 [Kazachstania naganishii CBS 8797]CCK70297.1 hypothetical protein KNAG_0E00290 [Kazachstania naganishii CBS 8797]
MMRRSTLLSMDAFSRAEDDVRVRTRAGAYVTLACLVTTVFLLLSEYRQWNTIVSRSSLVIDREHGLKLDLRLDVTFPHLPCDLVSFDVLDDSGVLLLDVDDENNHFTKTRIDQRGEPLDAAAAASFKLDAEAAQLPPTDPDYCGSCYGSRDQTRNDELDPANKVCCNTCSSVREAYLDAGWAFFDGKNIEQCEREGYVDKISQRITEGCRIKGGVRLNRVQGNIHFAPGDAFRSARGHFHDTSMYDQTGSLNFDHIIHHLSFGPSVDNMQSLEKASNVAIAPLDGKQVLPRYDSHAYQYTYFTKIVPTRFEYFSGSVIETTQFSSTFSARPIGGGTTETATYTSGGTPGLYFNIEMSPLKVIHKEQNKISWSGFLLNCITSIGGVLAVGTVVDKILYRAERTLLNKKQ